MPESTQSAPPKLIVIPRQLEGFFYERLSRQFAGRENVRVVIDRRVGERRRARWVAGHGPLSERRQDDRRDRDVVWSLPDMPFSAS
ncbi:MAG TPA: hypothetical protein VIL79_12045 [Thermoleophilia bacterium]